MEEKKQDTFSRLIKIIQDYVIDTGIINKPKEPLTPKSRLREDLGMDSLGIYCYAHDVMEEFKIYIPDEKIGDFGTIKDYMREIALTDCTINKL